MPAWVIWVIAAGALAVGELLTFGFVLGPLALAAVAAGVAGLAGAGVAIQLVVFIVAAGLTVGLLRPVARRHLRSPTLRSPTEALIGLEAVVLERVHAEGGQVKLRGEVWTARPIDTADVLEPDRRVQVLEIRGATAIVADSGD